MLSVGAIARPARVLAAAVLAAAALVAATAPHPAGACACGIALDATVSTERALVIETPVREQIILSLDLETEGPQRAAVVLPVPNDPRVDAVAGGADPLAHLDAATAPEPEAAATGGSDDASAAPGVDVLGRETLGGYDVSRLAAGDPLALGRWLDRNGYALPPGSEPVLADYVDAGWRFVAIRLAPGSEGRLKPLKVAFATDEVVYPMRLAELATEPFALRLYSLAEGPRQVEGLEIAWAGQVGELDPPPPAELARLFAAGSHVTRMEGEFPTPTGSTGDLVLEHGDDPSADAGDEDESLPAAAVAGIALAAAALLCAAVAWRARRP